MAPSDYARRLDHTGNAATRGVGFGAAPHLRLQVRQAGFQKLDPIDERGEGFPDRVGDEVMIEVNAAAEGEARSVPMHGLGGNADDSRIRGTLSMTTELAPTRAFRPTAIGPSILAPAPTMTPSSSIG